MNDDDNTCNDSNNETFQNILDARMSRRSVVTGGLVAAAVMSLGGSMHCSGPFLPLQTRLGGVHSLVFRASRFRMPTR